MADTSFLFLIHVLGFAGFLWLGLYAVTRGDRGRVAALLALAAVSTSCFFLPGGLLMALHGAPASAALQRLMWWSDILPVAVWLHLSVALAPRALRKRYRAAVLWAVYGCAAVLTLIGATTDLVNDYRRLPVIAGPAYILYAAYVLAGTSWAVLNVARLRAGGAIPLPGPAATNGTRAPAPYSTVQ